MACRHKGSPPAGCLNFSGYGNTPTPRGAPDRLAHRFLFHRQGPRAAGWALRAIAKLADVDFEFIDRPAEGIAMHAQLAGSPALVAFIFLENSEDKALLKFAHALGIEDVAFVHLQDERF